MEILWSERRIIVWRIFEIFTPWLLAPLRVVSDVEWCKALQTIKRFVILCFNMFICQITKRNMVPAAPRTFTRTPLANRVSDVWLLERGCYCHTGTQLSLGNLKNKTFQNNYFYEGIWNYLKFICCTKKYTMLPKKGRVVIIVLIIRIGFMHSCIYINYKKIALCFTLNIRRQRKFLINFRFQVE